MSSNPELPDDEALHAALRRLLAPLARLAVHRGVPHARLDACLREAFVAEAFDAHPEVPAHRRVSRVSAATGLNRREVQRILDTRADEAAPPRSRAAEVFAHWLSNPNYHGRHGAPQPLARTGPAPSFESLAHEVTRDVHPRSLLEELLRLKLVVLDAVADRVEVVADGFVPRGDTRQILGFLGDNVGDHLDAAVDNVVGDDVRHFEQALFADGLSETSMVEYRQLVSAQWRTLTQTLVPALERLLERDATASAPVAPYQRVRMGLYSYQAPSASQPLDTTAPTAPPMSGMPPDVSRTGRAAIAPKSGTRARGNVEVPAKRQRAPTRGKP